MANPLLGHPLVNPVRESSPALEHPLLPFLTHPLRWMKLMSARVKRIKPSVSSFSHNLLPSLAFSPLPIQPVFSTTSLSPNLPPLLACHPSPHPTSSAPQPLSVVTGNADNTIAKREERKRQNRLRRKALSQQRREIRKDVEKRKVEQRQERRSGSGVIIAGCFVNSHITINNNLVVHL